MHPWKGRAREPRIELGPYSDAIRKWLRRESAYPQHVYLRAVVATPAAAQIAVQGPYETRGRGWHHFVLHVPGLLFLLDVGKTVREAERFMSLYHDPEHPIVVCDLMMQEFRKSIARESRESRKTNAYLRQASKLRNRKP